MVWAVSTIIHLRKIQSNTVCFPSSLNLVSLSFPTMQLFVLSNVYYHGAFLQVLSRIFTTTEDEGRYCTIQEVLISGSFVIVAHAETLQVLEMPFFQQQTPPELGTWNMPQVQPLVYLTSGKSN